MELPIYWWRRHGRVVEFVVAHGRNCKHTTVMILVRIIGCLYSHNGLCSTYSNPSSGYTNVWNNKKEISKERNSTLNKEDNSTLNKEDTCVFLHAKHQR